MSLLLLFVACAFPEPACADGYSRSEAGECTPQPDASIDTGLSALSGAYQGDIVIDVEANVEALGLIEDVCTGAVAFDLQDADLDGSVQCVFSGTVGSLIGSDPFEGTLMGTVQESGASTGQILLELGTFGVLDEGWAGTTSPEQISGEFAGEMTFTVGALEVPVVFGGAFTAEP